MRKLRLTLGGTVARVQHHIAIATTEAPKVRQIHKEGEVNMSAHFPVPVSVELGEDW